MKQRVEALSDAVTLYLGDCRDLLPKLGKADAVVTDPPYGLNKDGQTASKGKHGGRKAFEFLGWDCVRPDSSTFKLILDCADVCVIWGGNYFSDYLPPSGKWLIWDKGQEINQSDGELAWTSLPGALRIFRLNRAALLFEGTNHPTQKPVALMIWCIKQLPDTCQTILDPFMGSGTTGVACVKLNRNFIGVELEPTYFDIACKRIEKALRSPNLFQEPKKKTKRQGFDEIWS